jgi:hypothetical protein
VPHRGEATMVCESEPQVCCVLMMMIFPERKQQHFLSLRTVPFMWPKMHQVVNYGGAERRQQQQSFVMKHSSLIQQDISTLFIDTKASKFPTLSLSLYLEIIMFDIMLEEIFMIV